MSASSITTDLRDRTVVRAPDSRLQVQDVAGFWPVIRALASRDLKSRYKQSALGPAWIIFQPLGLLAAFSIGFRSVAHIQTQGVPYSLFALSGLIVWSYVQAVVLLACGSLVNNYVLVRWTACPRLALPLAALVSNLPSFFVPLFATLIAAAAAGYLAWSWLLLPALCLWLAVMLAAVSVGLAVLSVRARDVISAIPFLLQVALFLSPVAYRTSGLSNLLRTIVALNPLTGLIDALRWAVFGLTPSRQAIVISLVLTVAGTLVVWRLFVGYERRMADEI